MWKWAGLLVPKLHVERDQVFEQLRDDLGW